MITWKAKVCEAVVAEAECILRVVDRHSVPCSSAVAMAITHALFESASGYAIFEVKLQENVGALTRAVQDSIDDLAKFGKMVSLISFSPFKNAAHALENANDISEGTQRSMFMISSRLTVPP